MVSPNENSSHSINNLIDVSKYRVWHLLNGFLNFLTISDTDDAKNMHCFFWHCLYLLVRKLVIVDFLLEFFCGYNKLTPCFNTSVLVDNKLRHDIVKIAVASLQDA